MLPHGSAAFRFPPPSLVLACAVASPTAAPPYHVLYASLRVELGVGKYSGEVKKSSLDPTLFTSFSCPALLSCPLRIECSDPCRILSLGQLRSPSPAPPHRSSFLPLFLLPISLFFSPSPFPASFCFPNSPLNPPSCSPPLCPLCLFGLLAPPPSTCPHSHSISKAISARQEAREVRAQAIQQVLPDDIDLSSVDLGEISP